MPIPLYASEVWGFHKLDRIEMLHRAFLKRLLNVNKRMANCITYGESGRHQLFKVEFVFEMYLTMLRPAEGIRMSKF